jgi:hypothetical protein
MGAKKGQGPGGVFAPNAVSGSSETAKVPGVSGTNSGGGVGVAGDSDTGDGMQARTASSRSSGIFARNDDTKDAPAGTPGGNGVFGLSMVRNASGVFGANNNGGVGVAGTSDNGIGIVGRGRLAGRFEGDVEVTGDIRLVNANGDCAEDFDVLEGEQAEPGTVMVVGEHGVLQQSQQSYDRRVAGVISGAGGFNPGITLDKQQSERIRIPIALMGKVYCKADAGYSPIETGDLLTTSPTPGHAMRADDPSRGFGAVIGKALEPLQKGRKLIRILIALQ